MKKSTIILTVLLTVCMCIGGFSLYKIHMEHTEIAGAEAQAAEYASYSPSTYFNNKNTYEDIYTAFMPELRKLKEINQDVAGWLYIPSTNIDYPVLQGRDNSYYLTHTVNGSYSPAGSVFVDARGFGGGNTVIYAHNMGRSSNIMFHDITNFYDINYFEKVKTGYFIDERGITELNIFAYSLTKPQTELYNDEVSLDFIKEQSINYREPSEGSLFTLSTCAYDYENARGILNCMGNMVYSEG